MGRRTMRNVVVGAAVAFACCGPAAMDAAEPAAPAPATGAPRHRDFDPAAVASAETAMWKAYYARRPDLVLAGMARLLQEQAGLKPEQAAEVARPLAMAAAKFQMASGNYEAVALPDLVAGYRRMKQFTGAAYDPERVAKAELEWWVRRRTPGRDSAESVGEAIAALYAELYGKRNAAIGRAGLLRAQAAQLRDSGGDWKRIEELLRASHESLLAGIAEPDAPSRP